MNYAGMHWPANAGGEHPDVDTILALPGTHITMCADSARFWYGYARELGKTVLWRGLPRPNKLPAMLGWDASKVVDECLNLWEEQKDFHNGIEYFTPINEPQFVKETGEEWQGYDNYVKNIRKLRIELRRRLPPSVRLGFPALVPGDDLGEASAWRTEALAWDFHVLHAYGAADEIKARYEALRAILGPLQDIWLGEWNANHTDANVHDILVALAEIANNDLHFLGSTYYIWETYNEGEHDLSVWGNDDLLALFRNPPQQPQPQPQEVVMTDLRAVARDAALEEGVNPDYFVRQIDEESGFNQYAHNPSGADGIAQIIGELHPGVDTQDPVASLKYAAHLVKEGLDRHNGNYALALSDYNAGQGNTARGLAGTLEGWPWAETTRYVSDILQISWDEARAELTGAIDTPLPLELTRIYGEDVPDEIVRQQNSWTCFVRSLYAAFYSMAKLGAVEPVTYGDGGPRDVYDWCVPTIDDESIGLHFADGSEAVELIKSKGVNAGRKVNPTLQEVQERAGKQPILLGFTRMGPAGHWVYCDGLEPDGTLLLENPAGTYAGISTELRDSFDKFGQVTMIWIDPPTTTTNNNNNNEGEEDSMVIQQLQDQVNGLISAVAYLSDKVGDRVSDLDVKKKAWKEQKAIVDEMQRVRQQYVGPRP